MSRSTAREVLTALAHRGLVVRPPNRSATVTRFTAEEVYETFNIREVLEGLCFRLAVENEPPESWQDLVDLYGAPMQDIIGRGDHSAQLKTIDYLIQRVRAASGNHTLCAMLESIDARSRYIICRTLILRGRLETGLAEVRGVIAAMRRGDAAEPSGCGGRIPRPEGFFSPAPGPDPQLTRRMSAGRRGALDAENGGPNARTHPDHRSRSRVACRRLLAGLAGGRRRRQQRASTAKR